MNDAALPYDVFLSHSAKDKAVVRPLAERLRQDGLKVPSKFGIRNSDFGIPRLCMSANAFGSDWTQLGFRRPQPSTLNHQPVERLDDAPSKELSALTH